MSDVEAVVELLKDKLTVEEVYTGEIPEGQNLASILVSNIANPYSRTLSGRKTKKSSVWRITVVAKNQTDVELVLTELEDMDGSSTIYFQRIYTNLVNTELGLIAQPDRRAFYDLIVYKR